MIVLKGDIVKMKSGETAEVLEIWGVARESARLKIVSDNTKKIQFVDEISEVIQRDKGKWGGRWSE